MTKKDLTGQSAWGASQTQFFYALTPDRILDAVEAAGLRCTGRCSALNSMENRVYEIEVEADDALRPMAPERFRIAKFYRPGRWTAEQILEEHTFLLRLADCDIQVAAPLPFDDGSTLREMPGGEGIYYALFPKVTGRSLLHDELSDEQFERLGRLVARIHNVGATLPSPHRLLLSPDTYARANLTYLQEQQMLPDAIANSYFKTAERLCALIEPLFEDVRIHSIHGDFHLGNVIWNAEGPVVVDFDDMVRGPAVQDLWLLAPGRDAGAANKMRLVLDAYEQMRNFDRDTLSLIEPLRALRYIHFSAWIARRWDDPAFPRAFPHFGSARYWQEQYADLREQLALVQEQEEIDY